ncbi:IPT/TIG domain-containing protein [Puia sp. P3]|uniref:IPT/TIG domain-containing protein n=1 Tax=Puia sp. P3 TaxID=3423952 RepID=UPI003D6658FB
MGDLDGDGKPELMVTLSTDAFVYVYENTSTPGNISFNATPVPIPASANIVYITLADFNGDGRTDIATLDHIGNSNINVLANNSTPGGFSFGAIQSLTLVSGSYPGALAAADLDGDGMPELAYTDENNDQIDIFQNASTRGSATITLNPITTPQPMITGDPDEWGDPANPIGLAAGDLDGDGKTDLVASNFFAFTLGIFRNTSTPGNISFSTESKTTPTPMYPAQIALSDLDGDGLPDLSLVTQGAGSPISDSVSIYRNTSTSGHASFAPAAGYLANSQAYWVAPADMDGDGLPDLPVVNNGVSSISILINKKSTDLAITSFSPATGTSGTVVTITGIDFTNITGVSFGGAPAQYTVASPTSIIATVGAGSSGLVKVTTANAFATMPGFKFQLNPPTITSFSPTSANTGTAILIKGTGFISNQVNAVSFGGTPATSINIISDTTISAIVGTGSTGSVKVMSLADTATAAGFIFTSASAGPPTISSFSPMSAMQGAEIVITGTNLSNVTAVTFGGTPAQSFQIYSDNSIHAFVAAGATGSVAVTGTNGNASYPGFTFMTAPPPQNPPRITSFTPQSAATGGTVTITGLYLKDVVSVSFGGSPAIINSQSDNTIVAIVGTGATGLVKVAGPVGADSLAGFIYVYDTTRTSPGGGAFQLVQFSGALSGNLPHINWQTRNDGGISFYAIERSVDGSQFTVVGTIPVTNKTGTGHSYTFTDQSPRDGINYYRLKMQDTTAHYSYGPTISLQLANSSPLLVIYPNPVKYGFSWSTCPTPTARRHSY